MASDRMGRLVRSRARDSKSGTRARSSDAALPASGVFPSWPRYRQVFPPAGLEGP
jgi:hypothetical protein